jgi:hypothetical protein
MKADTFKDIVDRQISDCQDMLGVKAVEYAYGDEDRLHNFRVAAKLHGVPMREALAGMMAKHTVSIYDMANAPETYSLDLWVEKLTDHINYLLLLRAVVEEEVRETYTEMKEES